MDIIKINSLAESELYECDNVTIKTDNDVLIGIAMLKITSRNVKLIFHSNSEIEESNSIVLLFQDILFHAIDKTNGFIMLSLGKELSHIINRKLYLYSEKLQLIFEQISIGSSLNPDEESIIDTNIMKNLHMIQYAQNNNEEEEEEEEEIEEEKDDDDIKMNELEQKYQKYDYQNSIDIFKCEKMHTRVAKNDPKRFEDAD